MVYSECCWKRAGCLFETRWFHERTVAVRRWIAVEAWITWITVRSGRPLFCWHCSFNPEVLFDALVCSSHIVKYLQTCLWLFRARERWWCRCCYCNLIIYNRFGPAEFSSNPNQTHLKQLIKVLLGRLETSRQVCWGKLELNSPGPSLMTPDLQYEELLRKLIHVYFRFAQIIFEMHSDEIWTQCMLEDMRFLQWLMLNLCPGSILCLDINIIIIINNYYVQPLIIIKHLNAFQTCS